MEPIPSTEYEPLASTFNPKNCRHDEWVEQTQEAGMKYMVLTTRHHNSFSLFDSEVSDLAAPKTAARQDLAAEYVEARRRRGMKIGFYYSLLH